MTKIITTCTEAYLRRQTCQNMFRNGKTNIIEDIVILGHMKNNFVPDTLIIVRNLWRLFPSWDSCSYDLVAVQPWNPSQDTSALHQGFMTGSKESTARCHAFSFVSERFAFSPVFGRFNAAWVLSHLLTFLYMIVSLSPVRIVEHEGFFLLFFSPGGYILLASPLDMILSKTHVKVNAFGSFLFVLLTAVVTMYASAN